uniref:Endonuclease/exonuclease/phosphatase domain-containing protein n=1 Tax=Cajanus cajan TaxID=3821 RepID=A0A151SG67_CAJCA|nr:hypothetical protein KK1_024275 [Cajanus cajan]
MLKIDKVTAIQARGRYARICVEMDLDKPLLPTVIARGYLLNIQYEGLHSISFQCGKYGHKESHCGIMVDRSQHSSHGIGEAVMKEDNVHDYGPWMLVKRHSNRFSQKANSNKKFEASRGFATLIKDIMLEYSAYLIFLLEMHVSGAKEEAIIKRIGLDGVFIEKVRGHVGGIWCLRNPSLWKVQVLDNSHYHVHMRVNWQNTGEWLLIVVYYSPHYQHRQELWDVLRELSLDIDCAWAILGDFNSIIHPHERKGGSANPSNRGILGFSNMINNCDLIDAIFQGYPLTWKRGSLEQRLDMLLINIQWRMKDLFVLCIECLFHIIQSAVDSNQWTPIRIARKAPKISHLAFADDLFLFAEASEDQHERCFFHYYLHICSQHERYHPTTTSYVSKKFQNK